MIWFSNPMQSIAFWNKSSLMMKNGLFTIASIQNDHSLSGRTATNHIQKWNASKCCHFGGNTKVLWILGLPQKTTTINSKVYCQQLMKLKQPIKEKRPDFVNIKWIILPDDKARQHTSLLTREKLLELV